MMRLRDIPALTGLRGIAAFWVFLFHIELESRIPVIEKGYLGVDVFFMLSGYILMYVYAMPTSDRFDYVRFIKARLARVYPLHLATLCLLASIVILVPSFAEKDPTAFANHWGADNFLASLLLIQNWAYFFPTCWNIPAWSLSAEWFAYLAFPLFIKTTQWPKSTVVPLILAIGSLGVFFVVLKLRGIYGISELAVTGTPGMVRMACEFTAGCLLFRAVANGIGALPRIVELAALCLVLLGTTAPGAVILCLPAFGLIILAANGNGWISWFLSLRPIVFLGEVSYSVYLLHWIIIQIFDRLGIFAGEPRFLRDPGLILLVIGLASLSYRYIEQPARAWGRRIGSHQSSGTARAF